MDGERLRELLGETEYALRALRGETERFRALEGGLRALRLEERLCARALRDRLWLRPSRGESPWNMYAHFVGSYGGAGKKQMF